MSESEDTAAVPARDELGRWVAGTPSPNPQGGAIESYPRDWRELRALAQQHAPEAIQKIVEIWRNSKSRKIQLAAVDMLLDRAYGKPAETVDVVHAESARDYSGYELARRVAWMLLDSEERAGIPPPAPLAGLLGEPLAPLDVDADA